MNPTPEPPTPPKQKATKAEVMQRVEEVMLIRLSGAGLHDVREYAIEKGWPLSPAQLYRYMQQADDLISDSLAKDRPKLLDLHVARRRTLFARCVESGDWRAALAVIRDEALLYRLYDRPEQTPDKGADTDATPEAALERLKAGSTQAVVCAISLLNSGSESVQLGAARALLETLLRYRDQIEVAARIEALEERAQADSRNGYRA